MSHETAQPIDVKRVCAATISTILTLARVAPLFRIDPTEREATASCPTDRGGDGTG